MKVLWIYEFLLHSLYRFDFMCVVNTIALCNAKELHISLFITFSYVQLLKLTQLLLTLTQETTILNVDKKSN